MKDIKLSRSVKVAERVIASAAKRGPLIRVDSSPKTLLAENEFTSMDSFLMDLARMRFLCDAFKGNHPDSFQFYNARYNQMITGAVDNTPLAMEIPTDLVEAPKLLNFLSPPLSTASRKRGRSESEDGAQVPSGPVKPSQPPLYGTLSEASTQQSAIDVSVQLSSLFGGATPSPSPSTGKSLFGGGISANASSSLKRPRPAESTKAPGKSLFGGISAPSRAAPKKGEEEVEEGTNLFAVPALEIDFSPRSSSLQVELKEVKTAPTTNHKDPCFTRKKRGRDQMDDEPDTSSQAPKASGSLFPGVSEISTEAKPVSSLFGSVTNTSSSADDGIKSLFASVSEKTAPEEKPKEASPPMTSLFGSSPSVASPPAVSSLFGVSPVNSTTSLFSAPIEKTKEAVESKPTGSLFGVSETKPQGEEEKKEGEVKVSLFGSSGTSNPSASPSLFGALPSPSSTSALFASSPVPPGSVSQTDLSGQETKGDQKEDEEKVEGADEEVIETKVEEEGFEILHINEAVGLLRNEGTFKSKGAGILKVMKGTEDESVVVVFRGRGSNKLLLQSTVDNLLVGDENKKLSKGMSGILISCPATSCSEDGEETTQMTQFILKFKGDEARENALGFLKKKE